MPSNGRLHWTTMWPGPVCPGNATVVYNRTSQSSRFTEIIADDGRPPRIKVRQVSDHCATQSQPSAPLKTQTWVDYRAHQPARGPGPTYVCIAPSYVSLLSPVCCFISICSALRTAHHSRWTIAAGDPHLFFTSKARPGLASLDASNVPAQPFPMRN